MYFNIDFNDQLIVTVGFQVKTHVSFISSLTEIFEDDFIQFSDILSTKSTRIIDLRHCH